MHSASAACAFEQAARLTFPILGHLEHTVSRDWKKVELRVAAPGLFSVNVLWSIAYFAAGCCIYLWLMSRFFIDMADSRLKFPVILALTAVTTLMPAAAGWFIEGPMRPVFPVVVLTGAAVIEAHRLYVRRRHRGVRPWHSTHPGVAWMKPFTTQDLAVTQYRVEVATWRGPRIRVAHLSDFHANRSLSAAFYRDAVLKAVELEPDFLFITGDFISKIHNLPILESVLPAAAGVPRRIAVLGNHDYWTEPSQVAALLRTSGFDVLENDHRVFELAAGRVVVSGCDDPWGPGRWTKPASSADDLVLVLSHTPDNIYRLARAGAHAVFSGHLHAGQFRVPGFGALAMPSMYGRRYDHGHFCVEGTHLFVSAGIGAHFPPVRVYCPPDLFVIDINAPALSLAGERAF
jgi:predicted MPP superfamily phosphohydrolase